MDEHKYIPHIAIINTFTGEEEHYVPYRKKRIAGVYAPDDLRVSQHRFESQFDWQNSATRAILYEKYPDEYSDRTINKN